MRRAIFLDRDGTINVEKSYLSRIEDFEFLPGAIKGMSLLQNAGYLLIIITNQSGIARGYYKEEDFQKLNDWMVNTLEEHGVSIAKVYYCPHHPTSKIEKYRVDCNCRKPKLGLYNQAIFDFDLDVDFCYAIGDKIRDCCICETTGCRGFLIANNEKEEIIENVKAGAIKNISYANSLIEAVDMIFRPNKSGY